ETKEKSIRRIHIAANKPNIRPIKIALERLTLLLTILLRTTLTSTPPPSSKFSILPKFSAPTPPAKSVRPVLVNDKPLVTLPLPVTIGLLTDFSLVMIWLTHISTHATTNDKPQM